MASQQTFTLKGGNKRHYVYTLSLCVNIVMVTNRFLPHVLLPLTWQSCTASLKNLSSSRFCSSPSRSKASLIFPRNTLRGHKDNSGVMANHLHKKVCLDNNGLKFENSLKQGKQGSRDKAYWSRQLVSFAFSPSLPTSTRKYETEFPKHKGDWNKYFLCRNYTREHPFEPGNIKSLRTIFSIISLTHVNVDMM